MSNRYDSLDDTIDSLREELKTVSRNYDAKCEQIEKLREELAATIAWAEKAETETKELQESLIASNKVGNHHIHECSRLDDSLAEAELVLRECAEDLCRYPGDGCCAEVPLDSDSWCSNCKARAYFAAKKERK